MKNIFTIAYSEEEANVIGHMQTLTDGNVGHISKIYYILPPSIKNNYETKTRFL